MERDELGDRQKEYENAEAQRRLMPRLPVLIRLDGRGFSKFTEGLARPYDKRLSRLMIEVTKACLVETNARVGYTQSDEITLVLYEEREQTYFAGRVQKVTSILAAFASVVFNDLLRTAIPEKAHLRPVFDCRAWNVPTLDEAANAVLWRELDAIKNSVSMAAQARFKHEELQGRDVRAMKDMLFVAGAPWESHPRFFRRGTYVHRVTTTHRLSPEQLADLPEKHHARTNPDLEVERTAVGEWDLPPLLDVRNRPQCLFLGAEPDLVGPSENGCACDLMVNGLRIRSADPKEYGPEETGWSMIYTSAYNEQFYVNVSHCPFCGRLLERAPNPPTTPPA